MTIGMLWCNNMNSSGSEWDLVRRSSEHCNELSDFVRHEEYLCQSSDSYFSRRSLLRVVRFDSFLSTLCIIKANHISDWHIVLIWHSTFHLDHKRILISCFQSFLIFFVYLPIYLSIYLSIHPSIHLSIYDSTALSGLRRLFKFLNLYTVGRTPWTGDQPIARPLPTHRTTQTQNKRIQTSMRRVEFEPTVPAFQRVKIFHALDRAVTLISWFSL
jgi:hypothetical protein